MKKRSEGEWQTSITVDLIWSELWSMFFKLVEWNYIASETCWGTGTDDLSLCSVAFFYYPFSISEHKCEAGAGKRGFREEGTERWSQGSLLNIFPKGMSANWKRGNNKHLKFWISRLHHTSSPPSTDLASNTHLLPSKWVWKTVN